MNAIQIIAAAGLIATIAPARAATHEVAAGPDAQQRLQAALIEAAPGDVIAIGAGRFELTDGLSLDVDRVTLRGAGAEATILSFAKQQSAGEGLLVTSDDVVLRDFAVEDSRGDGIKSKGANRIVYYRLRVEWTGGPKETNGAYGVYPVESSDVLIDSVTVKGASDAGIYVGQSRNIIVRNSVAMFNVAGIEIENCYGADVYRNIAMHNSGGLLVFDLPNLPQMGGHDVRLFANRVEANDTPNFAPKGNIVASVPTGTGVLIMANRDVHVFGNAIGENATANILLTGYPNAFDDKNYNPLATRISVHDNQHGRAGWAPGPQLEGGAALAAAFGGSLTPVVWDGSGSEIRVTDAVPVLSLGLSDPRAGVAAAKPALADLRSGAVLSEPAAIVLPAAMEAAIR